MKDVLIILLLISASKAELKCSNSSETSLTFQPSADNIEGRYKVEWCTQADNNVIEWELVMQYLKKKCINFTIAPRGSPHSRFILPVTMNLNCTQVCFSTFLDLVFTNTCYHIQTYLRNSTYSGYISSYDSFHYVTNNFTKEYFTNSTVSAFTESYDDGLVVLKWYLGHVPATDFTVHIWDNQTQSHNSSCKVSGDLQNVVSCEARLPPGLCYNAQLRHNADWTTAPSLFEDITEIHHKFCQPIPYDGHVWWSMTAVVVMVLMVMVVWYGLRWRHVVWQKLVRDH